MILSPFDPAAFAPVATLIPRRIPESPMVTVDQHLAVALHRAGRAGPYSVGADHPDTAAVAVLDRGGRLVSLHFNTPEDGTLGRRLAEFAARALNDLPAVARPEAAE